MASQYPQPIVQQPLDGASRNTYPFSPIPGLEKKMPSLVAPIQQQVQVNLTEPNATAFRESPVASSSPFHGVTRLSLVVEGENGSAVVSEAFNNGQGNTQKKGKYLAEIDSNHVFNFAPGVDKPKICWKVRKPEKFNKVTLELFCKGKSQPIWTLPWGDEIPTKISQGSITLGSKQKNGKSEAIQWSGSLDWEKTVRLDRALKIKSTDTSPAFPDGVLTVQHSPYQLRMTINDGNPGSDNMGYPLIAWTYIHVLVDSIELMWGSDALLSPARPDVDPAYEAEVLGYEKQVLQALQQKTPNLGANLTHEVLLTSNQFAHKANATIFGVPEYEDRTDFEEYKKLWGEGPRIPLLAKIYVKTAQGKPTEKAAPSLKGTRVLWDWQDRDPDRWKQYTADATYTSEDYLETLYAQQNLNAKPSGSSNCPSQFGGKLANPSARVFPPQGGNLPFPYVVEPCQNRSWAVLSKLGTTPTDLAITGVIFQPARMAGDRYEVRAYLYFDDALDSDQDIQVSPPRVQASAGKFEILRRINLTYMVRGSNADLGCDPDACIRAMKNLYREELGIVVEVNKVAVDNIAYQQAIAQAIEKLVQEPASRSRPTGIALLLRYGLNTQPPANSPGVCYVDYPNFLQSLENAFTQGHLRVVQLANVAGQWEDGEEIIGLTSGAKGIFLDVATTSQPLNLVLLNDRTHDFTATEQIRGRASKTTANATFSRREGFWGYTFRTFRNQSEQYAKMITVAFNDKNLVNIHYSKKKFTRSLKTELSDQAQQDLKAALIQVAQQVGNAGSITVEVRGRMDSENAKTRMRLIQEYLQELLNRFEVIDHKAVFKTFQDNPKLPNRLKDFQTVLGRGTVKIHDVILPLVIEDYVNHQFAGQKGIFMLHMPGTNNLGDLPQARGTYQTLISEGAYFADLLPNDRSRGILYLATVDPNSNFVLKGSFKKIEAVFSHEIAHALFKAHAPSMVVGKFPGQNDPPGTVYKSHVARDNCLMNYDVNSEHFCGLCMVRSRGWNWNPTQINEVEMEYQITLELGEINDLFTSPASIDAGKRERLQVLGLFNNPLNHADANDCFPFSWNHALSLFPQLQAPNVNLEAEFTRLIKDFLIEGGQLPPDGNFAKIRIPGGHTPLYSSAFLEARFTEEEQKGADAKRFSPYMLELSQRYQVEQNYYQANPSLGKIPLVARVKKRLKGSNRAWNLAPLAPEVQVYFQLLPPDLLPALPSPLPNSAAAQHAVAGGFSHYNQVAAPPLKPLPQQYITTKVDQYQPSVTLAGMTLDPQSGNAHMDLGGERGRLRSGIRSGNGASQNVFFNPRDQGWAVLQPVLTESSQHLDAVCVSTDDQGEAKVIFAPSRVGGDRYKIQAYVVTSTNDGTRLGDDVARTGTMVRWRTIRICRHVYMPPSATVNDLPNDLQNGGAVISPTLTPYVGQAIPTLDLAGKITQELAKSYCELILEPAALNRDLISNHRQNILTQVTTLLQDYPDFNKPRRCEDGKGGGVSIFKVDLTANTARTQFTVTLPTTPEPNTITIRPQGGGFDAAILSDEDSDPNQGGDIAMTVKGGASATGTVNYTNNQVKVDFKTAASGNYQVAYFPDSYVDVPALFSGFPSQSPFLLNLRLPADYNGHKRAGFLDFEVDKTTGKPTQAFAFIDAKKLGLVKGLLMTAIARGIDANDGFYPGLVIIQAIAPDTYTGIWTSGTQEGKGVGSGIFLFGNGAGDVNRYHALALHEMSHGLYFHHAPTGSGYKPELHDTADTCVMSYDPNDGDHCGQCVASLRGMNERHNQLRTV